MATITSNGTGGGLSNVGTTWAGGVVPVENDKVTIASTDTVTLTGTHIWGDDTTTALTVNGILKASRSVNSSLTVKGHMLTAATSTADIDYGKTGDTIPSGVLASLILNYSASMADRKYGLTVNNNAKFSSYGLYRQRNTTIQSSIAVGATSAVVLDATGWAVGDTVVFAETSGSANYDVKTILTLTPGSGTTATITFAATTYAHAAGCPIGNFTSNVTIACYGAVYTSCTYMAKVNMQHSATAGNNIRLHKNTAFHNIGGEWHVQSTDGVNTNTPWTSVDDCSFFGSTGVQQFQVFSYTSGLPINNLAVFAAGYAGGIYFAQGSNPTMNNSVVYSAYINLQNDYGPGGCGFTVNNSKLWCGYGGGIPVRSGAMFTGTFNDCQIHIAYYALNWIHGTAVLNRCNLGSSSLPGSPSFSYSLINVSANSTGKITLNDCLFPATFTISNISSANSTFFIEIVNRDADITKQSLYTPAGTWHRDNSVFSRGKSSIRLDTTTSKQNNFPEILIPAPNGVPVIVKVRMRKNSSYGSSTLPFVSLSGLGITPVVVTMTDVNDTWQDFTLTATQSSGANGNLSLVCTGQSTSASGSAWFDGVYRSPFVTAVDHYGYLYAPTALTRTVDPIIQQTTEATVAAYTGISISGSTITLTSNHTIRELYDYCQYYRAANQLEQFFTSTDGVNFTCTYNLTMTGASLTGTGVINMPTKTLTMTGGAVSSVYIYALNGNTGYLNVTGLSAHSVLLQDGAGAQLDYQASVTGTYSYFIPATATGTWEFVTKKAGYEHQIITFLSTTGGAFGGAVNTPQKITADGLAMYTGASSALVAVSFTGTTQANIDIGNGTATLQATFDETEVALATNAGLLWIAAGKDDNAIFNSASGDYLFMTDNWRLRRALSGDVNATLQAFAISTQGVVVDGVNGGVLFLTSDTPEAVAAAVWAYLTSNATVPGSFGKKVLTTSKFIGLK